MLDSLRPGALLGRYRLLALIARGGMGTVWRARDERLNREVAVKVLPEHLISDSDARRRFEREARVTASILHPNVVTIFDVGSGDPGTGQALPFLVMELLEGRSLFEVLRDGSLPPTRAVRIALQIARALGAAHRLGVIHRDLKPSNVMVMAGDHVKVLDFGLARLFGEGEGAQTTLTTPGMVLGSCPYMSPEQALGEALTPASDVFALGTVTFEMLTGERVFTGPTPVAVLAAVVNGDRRPLGEVLPSLPETLVAVVERCLERDPARRYADGDALARDLTLAVRSGTPSRELGGGPERTQPLPEAVSLARRRAHRRTAGLVTGVAAASLLLGGVLGLRGREARRPDPGVWQALRILEMPGALRQPSWHPDGSEIAVNHMAGGHSELLVVDLKRGVWRRIATGASGEVFSWPRFSPDGERIVVSVVGGSSERVEVLPAVGGPPVLTVPAAARAAWLSGGELVLARYRDGLPALVVHDVRAGSERPLLEPGDGSGWWDARLASGGRLAVLGGAVDIRGGIWVLDGSGALERWLGPGARLHGYGWAPGGRAVLAVLDRRLVRIRKERVDGVMPAIDGLADPAVSPDGTRLAMVVQRRRWEVVAVDPVTGERECLLCGRPGVLWGTMGRDGTFVFGREDVGGATVYRRGWEGQEDRVLPQGEHGTSPVLDPSGRRVAYLAHRDDGRFELRVADLAGGPPLTVATGVEAAELPSWSPDGTRLTWAAGSPLGVWTGLVGGGKPVRIARGDYPRWSPGGEWIVYVVWTEASDPDQGVWVVHPDGTGGRKVGSVPSQVAWSPTGTVLWQIRRSGEGLELWRCLAGTWRWNKVGPVDLGGPVFAYQEFIPFSADPGSGRLVLNVRQDTGELLLYEGLDPSRW